MATTSTTSTWYWYIRKLGKNWVVGLVDSGGAATTSVLTVDFWSNGIPDELTSDNDEFPIKRAFEHGFAMGCVDEVLRLQGNRKDLSFKQDYENIIYDAIHEQIQETQQPLTISPLDLRMDEQSSNLKSPAK